MQKHGSNRLLQNLSAKTRKQVLARTTLVELLPREVISEAGAFPKHAYFPISGLVSEVVQLADGEMVEIGLVGLEGVTGSFHLLGSSPSVSRTFIQIAGQAHCLAFSDFLELFGAVEDLHNGVLQYIQHQMAHLGQTAACNRVHDAGPRFARWLLTIQDRSATDEFILTQAFLAEVLGTTRPTISILSRYFVKKGVIGHNRGRIRISDRRGLEALACACYEATRSTLLELYG